MAKSILKDKSYAFAKVIVQTIRIIQTEQKEFVLTKQLLRSGTGVGALISEATFGQSKADFIHKLSIALKEANESLYWINLLFDTGYIQKETYQTLSRDCDELIKILVSSIKTLKQK